MKLAAKRIQLYAVAALMSLGVSCGPNADPPSSSDAGDEMSQEMAGASGEFKSAAHPTSGRAVVFENGSDRGLKLEEFRTDPGPALEVWLSESEEPRPGSYVSLGALKAVDGDSVYELPSDANLSRFRHVLIWCEEFSVLFGSAQLDLPARQP